MKLSTHGEINILKHLIIGLVYPAVLGTLLFLLVEEFGKYLLYGKEIEISHNSTFLIVVKIVLLISILCFYSCDFLYSTYAKYFRKMYFIFDLIILGGLYATFKATNYDSTTEPRISLILTCFLLFMILYIIWDLYEYKIGTKKEDFVEKNLYKKIIRWELYSIVSFTILLIASKSSKVNNL